MYLWQAMEVMTSIILFTLILFRIDRVAISYQNALFFVFVTSSLIIALFFSNNIYETVIAIFKILTLISIVYFVSNNVKISIYIFIIFSLLTVIVTTLYDGYSKSSVIPTALFFVLIKLLNGKGNLKELNYKEILILILFIFLDFFQGILISSRTTIIISMLSLMVLPTLYVRKWLSRMLIFAPCIYIGVLSFYYLFSMVNNIPQTISNIERSSMIYWCVSNFSHYLFYGPGVDVFKNGAENFMFSSFRRIPPNDPHSPFLMIFVSCGFLNTIIIYIYYSRLVLSFSRLYHHVFPMLILIYCSVEISLQTYSSDTRILLGVLLGVTLSLNRNNQKNHTIIN